MIDWILNPYSIPLGAWIVFGILSISAVAIGFVAGLKALWSKQEKRDGLR
jgi:hypothetical protein